MALKEKDELPVLPPNAGGGAEEMLLLLVFEKPKPDVAGAGAVELDPAEKAKLLVWFAADGLLLVVPIPPKENGLLVVGAEDVAAEFAGAATAEDAPNENGDEPVVALD